MIISRDVQFVENESWDGIIEKNLKIVSIVDHDDMVEEVVQTPNLSKNFVALSTPKTP